MRVATFSVGGERRVGVVDTDRQTVSTFDLPPARSRAWHPGADRARRATGRQRCRRSRSRASRSTRRSRVPRRNIFCVGKNYHDHAHEFSNSGFDSSAAAGAVPKEPIIFSKVPESVIGTERPRHHRPGRIHVHRLRGGARRDHRPRGRGISREDAFDYVWGYTIVNDVTARDLQGRYSQWLVGKSQDTFCPMGPWAVTRDETRRRQFRHPLLRQWRFAAELQYRPSDLRHPDHHRDHLGRHDPAGRAT